MLHISKLIFNMGPGAASTVTKTTRKKLSNAKWALLLCFLGGVLSGVLLLGLGGELLPEPELGLLLLEEMDLDLFLTLLAGLRSAEASVAPAAVVVLLEDGVGSSASFLLLGGIHPFGERSSSTCSAKRTS